jgi:anti-sigma B factor antagonist
MQNSTSNDQNLCVLASPTQKLSTRKIKIIEPASSTLNYETAQDLKRTFDTLLLLHAPLTILLDMHNVESLNSDGLIQLLCMLKSAIASQTTLAICSLQTQVRLVFEISKMDRTFTIFADHTAFNDHLTITDELDSYLVATL